MIFTHVLLKFHDMEVCDDVLKLYLSSWKNKKNWPQEKLDHKTLGKSWSLTSQI